MNNLTRVAHYVKMNIIIVVFDKHGSYSCYFVLAVSCQNSQLLNANATSKRFHQETCGH